MIQGVTMCAALCISAAAQAQAPVYDVGNSSSQQTANSGNSSSTLEQRITVLERMVDSRTQMQHRLQQQLDTMQGEIDELRGAVEVHTNQLEKVLERQRELYLEIDKRVEALKQAGVGSASGSASDYSSPAPSQPAPSKPQSPAPASAESESDAYDAAVNLILKSREYDKAIPAFQSFLSSYPNSEYAPNAHYWLGQLLFNQQKWSDASEQFNIVIDRFSDSPKRPDALLKLGVIAERQGNKGQARSLFQQVVNEYPDSSATKLAQSRLSGL
ncbi:MULTISPECIES: tol-pal system protein YbgF [unclassified Alteromonas]|uniref:tol-pal system protein YbgF n=1 Tax=unclassified Alteromonas TaxID=2614992 RepID=UPI000E68A4B0|nr:tol-pal system protein YbgF [Alteromonas sp. RKMC-009]AYA63947.1 tol-pal system protein YbgF [Alteromonas sp. RKMC-009]